LEIFVTRTGIAALSQAFALGIAQSAGTASKSFNFFCVIWELRICETALTSPVYAGFIF
jgi:hypothetical protein